MSDERTERVARAICDSKLWPGAFDHETRSNQDDWKTMASAAVEAYEAPPYNWGLDEAAPQPEPDDFHPAQCLPSCMMPDGGECCVGYAALHDAYWKLRGKS